MRDGLLAVNSYHISSLSIVVLVQLVSVTVGAAAPVVTADTAEAQVVEYASTVIDSAVPQSSLGGWARSIAGKPRIAINNIKLSDRNFFILEFFKMRK